MPRLHHIVEQILAKLREAEVTLSKGQSVAHVCRALSITEQTHYRWLTNTEGSRWIK
jgi:transposase-like protein